MEMTDKAKSRLYGLTAVACMAWLFQSVMNAIELKQTWSIPNLIFYLSMLLVISYTAYSSYEIWRDERALKDDSEEVR